MPFTFVVLPPQTQVTREWAERLRAEIPGMALILAEDEAAASAAIPQADGAFGRLNPQQLARATRLRWLQSPQIAPPAGYFFPELVEHPLVVTNMREIFSSSITRSSRTASASPCTCS